MFQKIQKWLAIILFAFSVFATGYNSIIMAIATIQDEYAKAIFLFLCNFGWTFLIYLTYSWYSKNK